LKEKRMARDSAFLTSAFSPCTFLPSAFFLDHRTL